MISKKCKYAIKALLYLADHQEDDRSIFSSEIAAPWNSGTYFCDFFDFLKRELLVAVDTLPEFR